MFKRSTKPSRTRHGFQNIGASMVISALDSIALGNASMPDDAINESDVRKDQHILVWRCKNSRLGIALSNRDNEPFQFHLRGIRANRLTGHRDTVQSHNVSLSSKKVPGDLVLTVPPQSFEFWTE